MFEDITITDIKEIFTVNSPKGRFEKMNLRTSYGLSFCQEGQITYAHNNRRVVSNKNCAVILPKGQSYTITGDKSGLFPVINFDCQTPLCDTVVSISVQNNEAFLKDFEKLKTLSIFKQNRAEMMSVFYHMLHRLSAQNMPCKTILPAAKYIEKNFQNPNITNAYLAQMCNISEVYFRRSFTKHFKVSPKQYILDIRINKAKQLLSEGTLKINAVAEQCGFSGQYHFCRIFKEKTGLTPTEYTKQNLIYKI